MKSFISALLCVVLVFSLSACFLFDAKDAAFGGQEQPNTPVEKELPTDKGVMDNYYLASGFKFVITEKWLGHIAAEISKSDIDGVPAVSRRFYYVDSQGNYALVLRIYAFEAADYKKLSAPNATLMLTGADGTAYVKLPFSSELPQNFDSAEDFDAVYAQVNSPAFTITAN